MNNSSPNDNIDSQALINQLVKDYMQEQKRKRRWKWLMRGLFVIFLIIVVIGLFNLSDEDKLSRTKPHVGLIDINGTIMDSQAASAENLAKGLDEAYDNKSMKAIILRINSPGGSPVQADYMFNTIQYYRKKNPDVKIYAVCVDLCASAAYYLASAADEIYANPSSMVGSIGVIYNGFGFVDAMNKVGVTRRLQTAGKNKAFLDVFSPQSPEQTALLQTMLDEIHQIFIARVKEGRGARLKINNDTFSGLIWTGQQAKDQGLIDGFASSGQVAREIVQVEQVVDYTAKDNVWERVAKNIGTAVANQLPVAMGLGSGLRA